MGYDTGMPIYVQIIERIKTDILNGTLAQGEKLPSIQDMAVKMAVNQNTVSRVYKECEAVGLIETKRGIGSFVIDNREVIDGFREEKMKLIIKTFIHDLEALGYSRSKIIDLVKSIDDEPST